MKLRFSCRDFALQSQTFANRVSSLNATERTSNPRDVGRILEEIQQLSLQCLLVNVERYLVGRHVSSSSEAGL